MHTRITSIDIAYRAGVSQATVSRALSGSPLVSEKTRKRVLELARELNYKVDKNASSLRRQRSGTLALLLFEDPTSNDTLINPFFLSMLGFITHAVSQRGYDLLVSFQQLSEDWHRDYQDSHKADGLILLGYGDYRLSRPKLEQLVAQGTHFVRWGAVMPGHPGLSIGCDNLQGGELATEHLIRAGRRRIAFIGDHSSGSPEFSDRYAGYAKAHHQTQLSVDASLCVQAVESTELAGFAAMGTLLDRAANFDAVFAASDMLALGAMRALQQRGIAIPKQVSVVGFDDIPSAAFANPPLTTVRQDLKLAGFALVDSLLALLGGQKPESQTLPTSLQVRDSSFLSTAPGAT